jgi:hypothetical protein
MRFISPTASIIPVNIKLFPLSNTITILPHEPEILMSARLAAVRQYAAWF